MGFVAVAGILALLLPSSLTVTRSDPSSAAEFAPVPGGGDGGGPSAELGLASGDGIGRSSGRSSARAAASGDNQSLGQRRGTLKRCVGKPPRQTEDRLSPPCVPYFEGDNGGATSPGVTKDEVRVLFYFDAGNASTSRGPEPLPRDVYYDLAKPVSQDDPTYVRLLAAYQRYFNDRFQTYDRFVHFFVHFGPTTLAQATPASRKSDASDQMQRIRPWAVVSNVNSYADSYVSALNQAGTIVFLGSPAAGVRGSSFQRAEFYAKAPALLWSYVPSVEQRVRGFVAFVCDRIVPFPVSFSGDKAAIGGQRLLGLLYTTDPSRPDLVAAADLTRKGIEGCGGKIQEEASFDDHSCSYCGSVNGRPNMAKFQQAGVTTIIMAGGYEGGDTQSASALGYRPEWVVAGDLAVEQNATGRLQDQSVWQHARAVTLYTAVPNIRNQVCFQAAYETDQSLEPTDIQQWGCVYYPDIRQLFTGVQVAGPRLAARSMDRGFHAIPAIASVDPTVPSCFYDPGDYTCVKDAQLEWWDPTGRAENARSPGCWRMMQGGRRSLPDAWAKSDIESSRSSDDPCNPQGPEL